MEGLATPAAVARNRVIEDIDPSRRQPIPQRRIPHRVIRSAGIFKAAKQEADLDTFSHLAKQLAQPVSATRVQKRCHYQYALTCAPHETEECPICRLDIRGMPPARL